MSVCKSVFKKKILTRTIIDARCFRHEVRKLVHCPRAYDENVTTARAHARPAKTTTIWAFHDGVAGTKKCNFIETVEGNFEPRAQTNPVGRAGGRRTGFSVYVVGAKALVQIKRPLNILKRGSFAVFARV